jgi:uncharacterized protein YlxW (UPF0749 family)
LTSIISCSVLIFQCRKLHGLLTKKPPNERGRTTPRLDDNVKRMKGLKSQLRSSVQKTRAELAEELRAVTQMQAELSSQLGLLQTFLTAHHPTDNVGTRNHESFSTSNSKED